MLSHLAIREISPFCRCKDTDAVSIIACRRETLDLESLPLEALVIRPAEIGNDAARAQLDDSSPESAHEFPAVRDEVDRAGIFFEADLLRPLPLHFHVVASLPPPNHPCPAQQHLPP